MTIKKYDVSKVSITIGDLKVDGFSSADDLELTIEEGAPPDIRYQTYRVTEEKFREFIENFYGSEEEFLRRVPGAKITRPGEEVDE
jgi:hypothetical protein